MDQVGQTPGQVELLHVLVLVMIEILPPFRKI
jgi:hypothetical protein